jgi:hypothetical protein
MRARCPSLRSPIARRPRAARGSCDHRLRTDSRGRMCPCADVRQGQLPQRRERISGRDERDQPRILLGDNGLVLLAPERRRGSGYFRLRRRTCAPFPARQARLTQIISSYDATRLRTPACFRSGYGGLLFAQGAFARQNTLNVYQSKTMGRRSAVSYVAGQKRPGAVAWPRSPPSFVGGLRSRSATTRASKAARHPSVVETARRRPADKNLWSDLPRCVQIWPGVRSFAEQCGCQNPGVCGGP